MTYLPGMSRRKFLQASAMSGAALSLVGCCDADPTIQGPSFWGYQDFAAGNSLVARRVYYPSWDRDPATAKIVNSCNKHPFPLLMFLHGQESTYRSWVNLPAHLARAGFIVVVPDVLPQPGWEPNALDMPRSVLNWIRASTSPFYGSLDWTSVGLCGHSYGATTAGSLAVEVGVRAFASLAGAWDEGLNISDYTLPLSTLNAPALFVASDAESDEASSGFELGLHQQLWDMVKRPKHLIKFWGAKHFDYLPLEAATAGTPRGPCPLVAELTAEVLATFFSRYMKVGTPPSPVAGSPPFAIPFQADSLYPPPVIVPANAGDYVAAFSQLGRGCKVTLNWETQSMGSITLG
jgi:pimeloyl-ACP methyl ester carboxylesterase